MLIELHTQHTGRWYWVSYPTAGGRIGLRLVATWTVPNRTSRQPVLCTVYGACDYSLFSFVDTSGVWQQHYRWVARAKSCGREFGGQVVFDTLDAAKVWLLTQVARGLRRVNVFRHVANRGSPFSQEYTYEAIIC